MIHHSSVLTSFRSKLPPIFIYMFFPQKQHLCLCVLHPAPKMSKACANVVSASWTLSHWNKSSALGQGAAFNVTLLWWVRVLFPTSIFVHQSLGNPGYQPGPPRLVGCVGWRCWMKTLIGSNKAVMDGRTCCWIVYFLGRDRFCEGWKMGRV